MKYTNPYAKNIDAEAEDGLYRQLEKTMDFNVALNTPVGKELFKDLILLLEEKFHKIYADPENVDAQDVAVFGACKWIAARWNMKIDTHKFSASQMEKIQQAKKEAKRVRDNVTKQLDKE